MIIPLKIVCDGYAKDFGSTDTINVLVIDLYWLKDPGGSCKANPQFFTFIFIQLELVSKHLLGQVVDILLDLTYNIL